MVQAQYQPHLPEPMMSLRPEAQLEGIEFARTALALDGEGRLLEQALSLLAAAERRLAAQRERIGALEAQVQLDGLTGLPNRRAFEATLYAALAAARRFNEAGALAFIDIDNFKTVNETLGRDAGDQVLIRVTELLTTQVRATDFVGRYGGDEFVVLLTRADAAIAELRLRRLQALINASYATHGATRIHVRASMGIARFGAQDAADTLIQKADAAMFADKSLSRRGRPMAEGQVAAA